MKKELLSKKSEDYEDNLRYLAESIVVAVASGDIDRREEDEEFDEEGGYVFAIEGFDYTFPKEREEIEEIEQDLADVIEEVLSDREEAYNLFRPQDDDDADDASYYGSPKKSYSAVVIIKDDELIAEF